MKIHTGYLRDCELTGCVGGCNDFHANCTKVPVLIIPLYPEEQECPNMKGELMFGYDNEVSPWTKRTFRKAELTPLCVQIQILPDG